MIRNVVVQRGTFLYLLSSLLLSHPIFIIQETFKFDKFSLAWLAVIKIFCKSIRFLVCNSEVFLYILRRCSGNRA